MDPGLNGSDGAFRKKVGDGRATHVVDAVVNGAKDCVAMVNMGGAGNCIIHRATHFPRESRSCVQMVGICHVHPGLARNTTYQTNQDP